MGKHQTFSFRIRLHWMHLELLAEKGGHLRSCLYDMFMKFGDYIYERHTYAYCGASV